MDFISYPARPINGGPLQRMRINVSEYRFQPKLNGHRTLVHVPSGTAWNRKGDLLSRAGSHIKALATLKAAVDATETPDAFEWLDCEGRPSEGALTVLDVIPADFQCREAGQGIRRIMLERLDLPLLDISKTTIDRDSVTLIPDWDEATGRINYELMKPNELYEGVVIKSPMGAYNVQKRNPTLETTEWIKSRFRY